MLHWHVRKNQSGFTLIEMLVTVILIGIVAAISAPNLTAMLNRNRSNEAMRQIEGALTEAQKQAIRRGRTCSINISINTTNSALVNPAGGGCLTSPRQLNENVILNTDAPGNSIIFTGKGTIPAPAPPAASPFPILFVTSIVNGVQNQQRCVVIVNSLGKIRTGRYLQALTAPLDSDQCQ